MTTFTTEDRKTAYDPGMGCVTPNLAGDDLKADYVAEAPYHPGYEDAAVGDNSKTLFSEYLEYKTRHLNTSKKIIEFMKGSKC